MKVFDSRNYLGIGILLLALTLAVQGATQLKSAAVVKDVEINSSGSSVEAKITATEASKFTYFELDAPHRLVVDFHDVLNSVGFKEKPVDRGGVERVRASYFTGGDRKATRIVFDLEGNVNYEVVDDGAGVVRVVFGGTAAAPDKPSVAPVVPEAPVAPVSLVAGPVVIPQNQEPPALPLLVSESPVSLEQFAALNPVPPLQAAPVATAAVTPAKVQITQAPPPTTPVLISPAQPQVFNGELISLDLKDVDIKDFFRLIADISGLNVFPDPNVSGSVTLVLKDIPWDQVLDAVLRNNNLTGTLQGNVLRISTNATLQAEENQRRAAREAQAAMVPLVARTYVLNYVRAADIVTMLRAPGAGILSARGNVVAEPRRNAILVTDVAEQFPTIEQLKNFVDVPSQQVEIEARLLSATRSFSREIGTQLGLLVGANTGNILTGGAGPGSPFDRTPAPRAVAGTGTGLPLVTNFPAAATSGLAFLMQPGSDILLDAIITAAEAKGTAKIISRPKVTTQNNQEAVVSQGFQIPVQTNVNNTITVTFLQFALELSVTPQITESGTILLTARIENSEPDFARAINGVPSVRTQQAQTQVLIPDGATAMIGGILVDTDTVNIEQVPGIGSLPVIGHLFKKTETIKQTGELLFFVTPRIKASDALTIAAPGN